MKKIPATAIQKQFWLIQQMVPDNSAYNIIEAFHLRGILDMPALEKSVNAIVARHEIFRTVLIYEKDEILQLISSEIKFHIHVRENDYARDGNAGDALRLIVEKEATRPFNLGACPLFRLTVVKRGPNLFAIIFVFHHCIADLESIRHFANELGELYAHYLANNPLTMETPEIQYSGYALWQKEWLHSPNLQSQERYWKNALKGASGFLQLPGDRQRPVAQTLEGAAYPINFDADFTQTLKEFSRRHNATIFLTMLAAYFVLLHRHSAQNDIIVGVPLTNRRKTWHKNMMGCFVNTVPLRVQIEKEHGFTDVLKQVRMGMLGAHRNQEIPLEAVLSAVKPARNSSYNPLYQAGFTFAPPMPLNLQGLEIEHLPVHHGGAQLDFFATFWEGKSGGIKGHFEYCTALFDEWRIKSIALTFESLLWAIMDNADQPVGMLPIVTGAELTKLQAWNATEAQYAPPDCVHRWFELQAAKTPDNIAVVYENNTLTYRVLDQRANRLAAFLVDKGVGPDTLVGVYMDRCTEMVVALLGILKSGGAYVPLDPDFPKERIAYMLDHSAAALVVTKSGVAADLPAGGTLVVCLDTQWAEIERLPDIAPAVAVGPDHLAYVMYTSGSTGKPKGVQIPHGAVVNFLASMSRTPGMDSGDVLLAVTTLSFDISVLEIFLPLVTGAKTVLVSRIVAVDGKLLREALEAAGATQMQATPTTWRLLLAAGWQAPAGFKALCGGEPLPADLAHSLIDKVGGVWNMYGPTETTIWSTCCHIGDPRQPISIGKPIGNTKTYLLDAHLNPVPHGVQGELLIGGAGVARGYLNAPELTAERFLADPFSAEPGARMYRTGDWCRFMQDGSIEFYSRIDNQVKVHGFRIELGEVESALNQHPQVLESAVAVQEMAEGNKRLIGYVVPQGEPPTGESLREFMLAHLPHYMVPSLFIIIERMPLTPNAKIDRKALPLPDTTRPELEEVYVAPADASEEKMAAIWRDILNIDRIGVHDNFFLLGGDSLLSVQMIARIQEEFKCDLRVVKLFQFPTIRTLLGVFNQREGHAGLGEFEERANMRKQAYARRRAPGRN